MSKVTYDKNSRIMSIRLKGSKSIDSDVQDNIVVDYDKNGSIVNIDIMDVSLNEFDRTLPRVAAKESVYVTSGGYRQSRRERSAKSD